MKVYILENPKRTVTFAQINVHKNGYSNLIVKLMAPFIDKIGTYRGLKGAKIGFGIHYYKGAKWKYSYEIRNNGTP